MRENTRQKRRTKSDFTFVELHPGVTKFAIFLVICGLVLGSIFSSVIANVCLLVVVFGIAGIGLWALTGILYEGVLIPIVETVRHRRLRRVSGE